MISITVEGWGSVPWQGQHSLLEALEDAGIDISYSCRAGVCAACRVTLIDGRVDWRTQPILSLATHDILACSVVPISDISIKID
jgi:ferredoxin